LTFPLRSTKGSFFHISERGSPRKFFAPPPPPETSKKEGELLLKSLRSKGTYSPPERRGELLLKSLRVGVALSFQADSVATLRPAREKNDTSPDVNLIGKRNENSLPRIGRESMKGEVSQGEDFVLTSEDKSP